MKYIIRIVPFVFAASVMFTQASCERDDPEPAPGQGGIATLRITPRHHSKEIDSCMVYIKYNTLDKPTTPYDDSARCIQMDGKPVATFSGLKPGNYYLYGRGYDPDIFEAVDGGAPFTIKEEKVHEYSLAVTEDH